MPAYATQAEFEAYVEGWVTDNAAALARLLERASRDVDAVFGPLSVKTSGTYEGFKLDPDALADWEAEALSRATCAQAEYRFHVGEGELGKPAAGGKVKGPDFEVERPTGPGGGIVRYSPKLVAELEPIRHLRRLAT